MGEVKMIQSLKRAVDAGTCVGCGACVACDGSYTSRMEDTQFGPVPYFTETSYVPDWFEGCCPGIKINYPDLYKSHFGALPENWLVGHMEKVRTGFSNEPIIRQAGASGGVLTQILIYLLESGRVDAVIIAQHGVYSPETASAIIATSRKQIIDGAQSVYIPVSMLDILKKLDVEKKYAITCLPEQSAALRVMQINGHAPANQIKYVLGPYTGTALYPAAIKCFLNSKRVKKNDPVTSLQWRAGEWPGYLEIITQSGRVIRTPKVYYNFLIPFFITRASLQSMDFTNEFADVAVGDAWSPAFEEEGGGHSVVVTRSSEMEAIVSEMCNCKLLALREVDPLKASDMHGHMLDFKKRGGWLRNQWRRKTGRLAPNYGYAPSHIPFSRVVVECVISTIFALGQTHFSRFLVACIPEGIIGPIFNKLRLGWKRASRPTKRKGLSNFEVDVF